MICPECKKSEIKSQVVSIFYGNSRLGTLDNFYDENGKSHYHDPNFTVNIFRCSNGHEFKELHYSKCSVCDYNKEKSKIEVFEDGFRI